MFATFKKIFVFFDMVINYGISPSTILHNNKVILRDFKQPNVEHSNLLEHSTFNKLDEG